MEWMLWLWLGLFISALFVEFATADMVSVWFALASIPSFLLALLNVNFIIQIAVFVVAAILLLVVTRPVVIKYFKTNELKSYVVSYIGSSGTCIQEIKIGLIGRVKVKNTEWSAISNELIEVGDSVRVLDIEGVKLIVEKI
jgi:membrane protein implicated in regulation of membrane protease activity